MLVKIHYPILRINLINEKFCKLPLIGMITAAIPWGYLSDILGRRKLLVYGNILDSACMLMCSMTQNVWLLMFFKYLGGIM